MIHDSGPAPGRAADAAAVSRVRPRRLRALAHPVDAEDAGQRLFNPGSPTDRRRQPRGTIGLLELADGVVVGAEIVPVTDER